MDQVLVARVGKAHGLKGEVTVQVHTDSPAERFAPGATFATEPAATGPLTLRSVRVHNGVHLLAFEGHPDRTAAEALRGTRLLLAADTATEDDEGWYQDDLVGLQVLDTVGALVGTVTALHTRPVQDLLEIEKTDGGTAFVPFVDELVPEVDVEAGHLVVDPPPGLLDLEA